MENEGDRQSGAVAASLMQLALGYRASRAVYVATELGIPDLLASRSMSSAELAAATKTHRLSVHRLMRALSALGVFEEREPDRFSLAPMGALLRRDVPRSLRDFLWKPLCKTIELFHTDIAQGFDLWQVLF